MVRNILRIKFKLGLFDKPYFEPESDVLYAKEHLEIINTLKPEFTRSDKMISALINYNNEKDHLNKMLQKLENLKLNNQEKIYLCFGIGKAYEDLGNFNNAFNNYYFMF